MAAGKEFRLMNQYLEAGKIVNTHGVRGEMKFEPWCDEVEFLKQFKVLYLDRQGQEPVQLLSVRPQKQHALIRLADVDTFEAAALLKGRILYLCRSDVTLPEGRYFIQDLIGCKVIDVDTGACYGTVQEVTNLGASDLYVLRRQDGREVMIPAVPEFVKEKDVPGRVIRVKNMKGLFEDAD